MTAHLTAAMLCGLDACSDQVAIFASAFPDGLTMPTEDAAIAALAAKVAALRLDVGWAAEELLSPAASLAYDKARVPASRAYNKARAPARRAYDKATAPARIAYAEATDAALRAYAEATDAAYRAYCEAIAPASRTLDAATAPARLAYAEACAVALLRAGRDHGWRELTTTTEE